MKTSSYPIQGGVEPMNTPLLTQAQMAQLMANWVLNESSPTATDFSPVVKMFTPDSQATWLLTEMNPADGDTLFGLCDLGLGEPELGYVSLTELQSLRGPWGLPIERDTHFQAQMTLTEYADLARQSRRIIS